MISRLLNFRRATGSRIGVLSTLAILLAGAPAARSADLYWDANGTTAGITDGAGAWLTANQWWDGTTNASWTSGDSATFGFGGGGGAVTLASPTTVDSLKFNYFTGTYTLGTAANTITINNGITKNAGSGIVNFASNITLGAAQTWTNNSTANLTNATGLRTLDNGGFNLTLDGTGNWSMVTSNGNTLAITGAGGLIKNGTGDLTLDSNPTIAHSFTGDIVVNGGSIGFQSSAVLSGKNTTLNGGYLGGRFNSGFTWTNGLGTGANQIQIIGGVSGFSGESNSASTFQIGSALSVLKWGAAGENGATGFFNPSALLLNGSARMNANGTGPLNNGIDLNGSNRTFTSNHTNWDGASATGGVINGAVVNTAGTAAGIIRTGIGNLSLIAANTYDGSTTINGGTLTLRGSGTANSTSALNLGGGILRLVNTAQVNRFADAATITVTAGGGITYENTSGANVYTETLAGVALNGGQLNVVLATNQAGAGSQTLTFGTSGSSNFTQSGTATATFSAATTGPQASGSKNMIVVFGAGTTSGWVSGDTSNTIIGPWATTGTTAALQSDYAVYNGDFVVPANTVDSAETTWTDAAKAYTTSTGGTVTLTGTRTITALRNTGATTVLTLASGANLETYGLLNGTTTLLTVAPGTGGVLTTPTGGGNLYVTAGSGAITISAPVTNNSGNVTLVKSGSGTVILTGANNTYSGDTVVNAGILQIGIGNPNTSVQLSGGAYSGNIFIAAGATLAFSGSGSNTLSGIISGDGNLNLNRGTTTLSGANTYTGKTSLILLATNATGSTINVSSFNSVVGGTANSSLGAPTTIANGTIDFGGGSIQATAQINYTGAAATGETTDRIINFQFNNASSARVISASGSGLLKFTSAPISNGVSGPITLQGSGGGEFSQGLPFAFTNFTKTGAGTWTLGGGVGHTGTTSISQGKLIVNNLLGGGAAPGAVTVSSGATLGGTGTVRGATNLGGILSPGNTLGTLTFGGNLNVNNGSTYSFEAGDLTNVLGTLDLNDNWTLALGSGFTDGGSVTLFTYASIAATPDLDPTFDITNLGFTPGTTLTLTDTGSAIVLNGISVPIPEPTTIGLFAVATLGVGGFVRRRLSIRA